MMTHFTRISLLALPALALTMGQTATAAPLQDPAWTWVWEATSASTATGSIETPPGTPVTKWSLTGFTTETNDGAVSTFDTMGSTDDIGFVTSLTSDTNLDLDGATGYTIEWRAELLDVRASDQPGGATLSWEDTSSTNQFFTLGLARDTEGQDYVQLRGSSLVNVDISSGMHTFRVTVIGNEATLYIDDTTPAATVSARTDISRNDIRLGDQTSNTEAKFTTDYIRITDEAAYVPEPGSLALAGLGAAVLLTRRRRY